MLRKEGNAAVITATSGDIAKGMRQVARDIGLAAKGYRIAQAIRKNPLPPYFYGQGLLLGQHCPLHVPSGFTTPQHF
jgi:hypothetical protein